MICMNVQLHQYGIEIIINIILNINKNNIKK